MNLDQRVLRLERAPGPPDWDESAALDKRLDGYTWRLYLNIVCRPDYQPREDDTPDDQTPEERARLEADYVRILTEAFHETREPLTPEAQEALHSEMRRVGLGHLIDGEAA
jgi:hypothetical protein